MSEYNWREHWEPKYKSGEAIAWIVQTPVGLVSATAGEIPGYYSITAHDHDGMTLNGPHCLIPKRKLRPWTAKEWGSRIGDEFVLNDNRVKLIAVAITTLCFEGASEHFPLPGPQYAARQDDKEITQLDGSPCGEYE